VSELVEEDHLVERATPPPGPPAPPKATAFSIVKFPMVVLPE
jgi:hypothetical protein